MPDVELKIPDKLLVGGVLPGETVLAAVFQFAATVRETMSQSNRDDLDALNLKFYRAWLKLFGVE